MNTVNHSAVNLAVSEAFNELPAGKTFKLSTIRAKALELLKNHWHYTYLINSNKDWQDAVDREIALTIYGI